MSEALYDDALPVREARSRYFEANGFGADGGYGEPWVRLDLGPVPVWFPNTAARRRAVRIHDLNHVVTGYATTPTGEAEIGAFEVAAGCGGHAAAWALNLAAMAYGVVLAPRRLLRAFARGRRSGSLYAARELDEGLLELSVGTLRERLHVPAADAVRPGAADVAGLAAWAAAGWLAWTAALAALVLPLALAGRLLLGLL